ncbi:unnamed protein product [Durusdinium trenchii]|uniref:Uncharacterized protein n=1 Tax=Durusdinium trenchii TaxID=1381693 RepID=A0ABP0KSM2_9DINO
MPRPALRESEPELPSEESAKPPRSLSPPRFFSDHKPREASLKVRNGTSVNHCPSRHEEDGMTATARLRLDEASRLFPEAHRPHDRRAKQEPFPHSFGRLHRCRFFCRNPTEEWWEYQGYSPGREDGLGMCNRLTGFSPTEASPALRPWALPKPGVSSQPVQQAIALCAVPHGSLGPPGVVRPAYSAAQEPGHGIRSGLMLNSLALGQQQKAGQLFSPSEGQTAAAHVLRARSGSPCRPPTGFETFFDRPLVPCSVGAPVQRPFTVQQGLQSLTKLSTIQLGGLQPKMGFSSTVPQSSGNAAKLSAARGRSLSPMRLQVASPRSLRAGYPVSPAVSPGASFRYPVSPAVSPGASFRYPVSPAVSPGASFRYPVSPAVSPGASFRYPVSPVVAAGTSFRATVSESVMLNQPTTCPSPPSNSDVFLQAAQPVLDPRVSPCPICQISKGAVERPHENHWTKDSGVPLSRTTDVAADAAADVAAEAETSEQVGGPNWGQECQECQECQEGQEGLGGSDEQSNLEDLEETYILSAFRSEPAVCGAKPWAQLDEEKGLPSVESLRATLQALRAQDRFGAKDVPPVPTVPSLATCSEGVEGR